MPWIPAAQLRSGLLVAHGAGYEQKFRSAIFRRLAAGILKFRAHRILCDGSDCQEMPVDAWNDVISSDWVMGDFTLRIREEVDRVAILTGRIQYQRFELFRVEFDGDGALMMGIANVASIDAPAPTTPKRGRRPKYDWPGAMAALQDDDGLNGSISDVADGRSPASSLEKFMQDWFAKRDQHPAVSSIRAHVADVVGARRDSNASTSKS